VEDYDDKKCLHLQSSFVEPACSCVRGASFVEQFFVHGAVRSWSIGSPPNLKDRTNIAGDVPTPSL
jgi:hypothetical protein